MKHFKILLFSISCLFTVAVFSACGDSKAEQGKEYTSAYICPMHCDGSGSEKAGTCPVCKMDYVANADYKPSEHDTDGAAGEKNDGDGEDSHEGHDHDNHEGHNH